MTAFFKKMEKVKVPQTTSNYCNSKKSGTMSFYAKIIFFRPCNLTQLKFSSQFSTAGNTAQQSY